jgi:uncharacterized protein YciI
MPHFVLHCLDNDNSGELRPVLREAHLAHVRGSGITRLAGPLLDAHDAPIGSLLIVEADNLGAARAFSQADPYRIGGVFRSVEITPMRLSFVDLPEGAAA